MAAPTLLGWAAERMDLNRAEAQPDTRTEASAQVLKALEFVLKGTCASTSPSRRVSGAFGYPPHRRRGQFYLEEVD